jgi:hypothetical protein
MQIYHSIWGSRVLWWEALLRWRIFLSAVTVRDKLAFLLVQVFEKVQDTKSVPVVNLPCRKAASS